jgi:TM2 domain-containing membrane protein YozV
MTGLLEVGRLYTNQAIISIGLHLYEQLQYWYSIREKIDNQVRILYILYSQNAKAVIVSLS